MIEEISIALQRTLKTLKKKPYTVSETNEHRHRFILCNDGTRIYFIFKKQPLNQWLRLFPKLEKIEEKIQYVDSINIQLYYKAKERFFNNNRKNNFILVCYEDETILKIPFEEWLSRANNFGLYRSINNLKLKNKKDYSGEEDYSEERTMSCYFTEKEIVQEKNIYNEVLVV